MRRASSHFWRVLPLILIVFSFAAVLLFGEQGPEPSLEALITGSSSDSVGVASSIEERDLPLALAASEIVKFRALHGEIPLTAKSAEEFKAALMKRMESAKNVSMNKTESCSVAVAARSLEIAGQRIDVPAHFTIPEGLIISSVSPDGEAGTLLPDIRVAFFADAQLKEHTVTIDGKRVSPVTTGKNALLYRPLVSAASALNVGTHTASVVLQDVAGRIASKTWQFTVGIRPVPSEAPSQEAHEVGSFSLPLTSLGGSATDGETLLVKVSEAPDGRRFLLYTVVRKDGKKLVESRSLYGLAKRISRGFKRGTSGIKPKTPMAFAGSTLTYTCPLDPSDTGTMTRQHWRITGYGMGDYVDEDATKIDWTVRPEYTTIRSITEVSYTENDGSSYSHNYYDEQYLDYFNISMRDGYPNRGFILSETGHEKLPLDVSRSLYYYGRTWNLVEGLQIAIPEGAAGKLTVTRSRLSVSAGNEVAAIDNPTEMQTAVTFKDFGSFEAFNDLAVSYDYGDEHYEHVVSPKGSNLFGVYPYKASVTYEKSPPGILMGTSRKFTIKQIDLTIDGKSCRVTGQGGYVCEINPPLPLAVSTLLPNSQPLVANVLLPIIVRKTKDALEQLPLFKKFQTTLSYDKSVFAENNEIPCRAYFLVGMSTKGSKWRGEPPIDWETFDFLARPMGDWFSVKTFPNPAELVQVEMEPPTDVFEEQETDIPVAITPLPGMGTGRLTKDGGTIDLLEGYESQKLDDFTWKAKVRPPIPAKEKSKSGALEIKFKSDQGSGTYDIEAAATLTVKEKETGTTATVTGVGTESFLVQPGLKILSPTEGAAFLIGQPITIATNKDGTPDWKNIQWSISPSIPFSQPTSGPWPFTTDEAKNWTLTAKLKVSANQEITSVVRFSTKKVDISISPARKISVFSGSTPIEVGVSVSIDGKQVERPSSDVPWGNDGATARVIFGWEKVVANPTGNTFSPMNDSFSGNALFSTEGAMTIIASVAVEVTPKTGGKGSVYSFPNVRSDLWTFSPPVWTPLNSTLPDGKFPGEAVAPAGRTFSIKDGRITFAGGNHAWNPQTGLSKPIELSPAIPSPSILPVFAHKVKLAWSCPNNSPSEESSFVPTFKTAGTAEVKLQSFLEFDDGSEMSFADQKYPVRVVDIADLVETRVEPSSFHLAIGKTMTFSLSMKPTEVPPANTKRGDLPEFDVLKHVYHLTAENVSWYYEIASTTSEISEGLAYDFSPSRPGTYRVFGSARCRLEERGAPEGRNRSVWSCLCRAVSTGIVNPLEFTVKSIEFTSDHNLLRKNPSSGSIFDDSKTDYETPEWLAGVRSNPISHTKNLKIAATVKIQVRPAGIKFDLFGTSEDDYMNFEKTDQISTGEDQDLVVIAKSPLPNHICILEKSINWKIKVGSLNVAKSLSSDHKIYVTYGPPEGSDPTDIRLSWSCEAAWGASTTEDIAAKANYFLNTADPPNTDEDTNDWPMGTPPIWFLLDPDFPGGSCIAHSNLLKHILNILGIPGGSLVRIHASTDLNFDRPEPREIHGRQCKVFVYIEDRPELYEGCLEINSLLYPGLLHHSPFSSKQEVHAWFAAPPNRLIYRTAEEPYIFFDKNLVEYDSPLKIPMSECLSIPGGEK